MFSCHGASGPNNQASEFLVMQHHALGGILLCESGVVRRTEELKGSPSEGQDDDDDRP